MVCFLSQLLSFGFTYFACLFLQPYFYWYLTSFGNVLGEGGKRDLFVEIAFHLGGNFAMNALVSLHNFGGLTFFWHDAVLIGGADVTTTTSTLNIVVCLCTILRLLLGRTLYPWQTVPLYAISLWICFLTRFKLRIWSFLTWTLLILNLESWNSAQRNNTDQICKRQSLKSSFALYLKL